MWRNMKSEVSPAILRYRDSKVSTMKKQFYKWMPAYKKIKSSQRREVAGSNSVKADRKKGKSDFSFVPERNVP